MNIFGKDKQLRGDKDMNYQITDADLQLWDKSFKNSAERRLAALALSKSELYDVAFSQSDANAMHQLFSVEIRTMDVTNQLKSGRCWLFAAANVLREHIGKKLNIEKFRAFPELSGILG